MITDLMKDLVGKIIIVWGTSGRRYEGRLKESETLDMVLELKDGFINISLPCCEAIAWKKDLAEIAANAPELVDYPELPGGWPRNYSKKPKPGKENRHKPEPDERHIKYLLRAWSDD